MERSACAQNACACRNLRVAQITKRAQLLRALTCSATINARPGSVSFNAYKRVMTGCDRFISKFCFGKTCASVRNDSLSRPAVDSACVRCASTAHKQGQCVKQ